MDNKKDISKIILEEMELSKETLRKKNDDIISKLTSYKKELLKEDMLDEENEENEEFLSKSSKDTLFEYDDEYGYKFDLNGANEEEIEIVNDVLMKDPIFALKFLERKKDYIPKCEYENLKSKIVGKMDLN